MSIKQKMLIFLIKFLKKMISIIGGRKAPYISAQISEALSPVITQETIIGEIKFFCPGDLPAQRARTLLTKEPETIQWINTFKNCDVFWDIGANVGLYTLYAAIKGSKVIAFEPSPSNYYLLSRNIELNKVDSNISALCLAFNSETKMDTFYMGDTVLGGALYTFGDKVDWQGKPLSNYFKQAMIGFSIDDFIEQFNPPFPNHIKIDVDGNENKIIHGGHLTLNDKRLKSLLIELDTERKDYCTSVIKTLENSGLKLIKKEQPPGVTNTEFSFVYNHIFARQES